MLRDIIKIDEDLCDGCGLCVPNCVEGALQVIDGKVRLISDLFCDGLGACIGHCPTDAIKIEKREAEPYDEKKVMENIVKGGQNVILAHLKHMLDHNEIEFYNQAIEFLKENNIDNPMKENIEENKGIQPMKDLNTINTVAPSCGCSGSAEQNFKEETNLNNATTVAVSEEGKRQSELQQWPVQLHLLNPAASYFKNADVLLTADCVPFAMADFHKDFVSGKTVAMMCPKLDSDQDRYLEKLVSMIDDSNINSFIVMIMEVPCCSGMMRLAQTAVEKASRKIPIKKVLVSVRGEVLEEKWV